MFVLPQRSADPPAHGPSRAVSRFIVAFAVAAYYFLSIIPSMTAPSELTAGLERQVTRGPGGRILTNTGVWSPDGQWIVYDTRSDPAGDLFDGRRIERVHVHTGEIRVLYEATNGAHCGVVTHHPRDGKVVLIQGPEHPTADWSYGPAHRQGVLVESSRPGQAVLMDARDLTPPFTPGALRGGTHLHVFDAAGDWISFTYEDHLLSRFHESSPAHDTNLRNIGVSAPIRAVRTSKDHPRNQDGTYFSVLVTRTTARPEPGSDQISRAFEESWVGTNGYLRADGTRQPHALAFQGNVVTPAGETIPEVFLVDLPDDLATAGDGPLAGTETRAPFPPQGTQQRRLTFTADRRHRGLQGPRHWLRSAPDGSRIAFLMRDDAGIVQLWTVSPNGGGPEPLTRNPWNIASAFTWSCDGRWLAHIMDNSVAITDTRTGATTRVTPRSDDARAPRPEGCVFSPDGKQIAFVRRLQSGARLDNQICVVTLPSLSP